MAAFSNQKALTLLEILVVVAVASVLTSFAFPVGLYFYKSQQLESQAQGIVQALRRAQLKAMSAELDSGFGVYLAGNQYVLFKGNSYDKRDSRYDEIFGLPLVVTIADSPREIVFSKIEGRPSLVGSLKLEGGSASRIIAVNRFGAITLE